MTTQPVGSRVPQWTLADRLRKARQAAPLHQQELADKIGISRHSVSSYENGDSDPARPVLVCWALATKVSPRWLQTGVEPDGEEVEDALLPRLDSNQKPAVYLFPQVSVCADCGGDDDACLAMTA